MREGPFLLHGVGCGACGLPGYRHDPRTGTTEHVSTWKPPCHTKLPVEKGARRV